MRAISAFIWLLLSYASSALAQVPQDFIANTVPKKYPQLVAYIKANGPQQISWMTASKESQSLRISLTKDNHLTIESQMYFGSASTASSTSERTKVVMIDRKLDGKLDRLEATPPGSRTQTVETPKDEGSSFLWYSALSIAFRQSPCCKN